MRAVRYDKFGGTDVLNVVDVPDPQPGPGEVVVGAVASSINPGEIMIREGAFGEGSFPSGQGSDLAGRITAVGPDVTDWSVGDEVIAWSDERSAQAELVLVPVERLVAKPPNVSWDAAGSLYVAGGTAYALRNAVTLADGNTAVVAGAAGGVGSILVQLLRRDGVRVLGIAGPSNADWLRSVDVEPVEYGDGLGHRLRDLVPDGIDAMFDAYGGGYVELAAGLGVAPERNVTIIDFDTAERLGTKVIMGYEIASAGVFTELAEYIEAGEITIPIAQTFPLDEVRAAYDELAKRHTRGKIVLRIGS